VSEGETLKRWRVNWSSVFLGIKAEMLFDPVKAGAVVIDGDRDGMNIFAHADEFGLNPIQGLGENADLGLGLLVARGGLDAHFLQKADGMVVGFFRHISNYIVLEQEIPVPRKESGAYAPLR
jgi:hypothetical protein